MVVFAQWQVDGQDELVAVGKIYVLVDCAVRDGRMLPENSSHGLSMAVRDERMGYKWRHRLTLPGNLEIFFLKVESWAETLGNLIKPKGPVVISAKKQNPAERAMNKCTKMPLIRRFLFWT
jgi:hypothetical protein